MTRSAPRPSAARRAQAATAHGRKAAAGEGDDVGFTLYSFARIGRLYRDVPMLLIGEGTAEIQKMIIGRRLLERFAAASG